MKIFFLFLMLFFCNTIFAQKNDTCIDNIILVNRIDSVTNKNKEIDSAVTMYGKQLVIANYISIVSFSTVIIGTIIGMPASPLLLTTGVCDFATLLISGHAAKKLARRGRIKK